MRRPLPASLRDAYLDRLHLDAEPPSADALFRLHRAHAERVPYETLWIHLGDRWGIAARDSAARIARLGRGGYCFHLNGAFAALLDTLGYDVVRHVGGVHGPDGPTGDELANHLVLTVHGVVRSDNPDGTWYVDVGMGDALHEPLPLVAGEYRQGPFVLGLARTDPEDGWHLAHDPAGACAGMTWRSAPTTMQAFRTRHAWLSTSPDSGFVRLVTVQRRDADGVDILRGLTLRRVGAGASSRDLESRAELVGVLSDVFGLDVTSVGADALDALWHRSRRAHEAWDAAGRP